MAKKINLTSGSILNGSPITFSITPQLITGKDANGAVVYPSFHRIIVEVKCGLSTGSYETIKMSAPIEQEIEGLDVSLDISSALRTLRDSYEYTPYATTYPYVSFNVKAYDEYMLNGEVRTNQGILYYPSETTYLRTLFGAFSDFERYISGAGQGSVMALSRKPTSSPHAIVVGDTFAYTPPYDTYQTIANSGALVSPTSKIVKITQEGLQTIGGQSLYALPAEEAENRMNFRFINSFGVLESISVPKAYSKKLAITTSSYTVARQETFNKFSRAATKKQNNRESWLFITDPLNEDWLSWYLHEFLMSEHIWIEIKGTWIPCTITPEEETTMYEKTNANFYSVSFTAQLDINGSPYL